MSSTATNKQVLTTPNPFEIRFGYHRAVRRGPFIFVSGTTALKLLQHATNPDAKEEDTIDQSHGGEGDSTVHFPGDAYKQGLLTMKRCTDAVTALGSKVADIVRVRMYVARSEDCAAVGRAFKECFGTQQQVLDGVEARSVSFTTNDDDVSAVEKVSGSLRNLDMDTPAVAATMIVLPGGFVDDGIMLEVEVDAVVI